MCGRSSLTKTEQELEERFEASFYSDDLERYNPLPNYNIAPTNYLSIITNQNPDIFVFAKWGLIPSWAKNDRFASHLINARKETLFSKPSFKNIARSNRCIIPIDGYYEWKKLNAKKSIPYRVTLPDHELFAVAGLYDMWEHQGEITLSFTIITQEAPDFMMDLHPRVPLILNLEQEKDWLNRDIETSQQLPNILPPQQDNIRYYTVSPRVNKVINNDASLIEAYDYPDLGNQLSLF